MFTLKLYGENGYTRRIIEAESFHINIPEGGYEITAFFAVGEAKRFDIGKTGTVDPEGGRWDYAFIENAAGRTTERLYSGDRRHDCIGPPKKTLPNKPCNRAASQHRSARPWRPFQPSDMPE